MTRTLKRLFSDLGGALGGAIVLLYVVAAVAAPLVAPHGPLDMDYSLTLNPPSASHWMGTDRFGRDVFSRVVYGARISLYVAFFSIGASALAGALLGSAVGYVGKSVDMIFMRLVDILMAFPALVLALTLTAFLGTDIHNLILAIAVVYSPQFIRLARGNALALRDREFVQAARAAGASRGHIVYRHVIPNVLPIVLAQATLGFSTAILMESALSFLGLGVQPPTPSWGTMIASEREFIELAPWLAIFPGLAISVVVIALNLFGDRVRDVFDPRLRGRS